MWCVRTYDSGAFRAATWHPMDPYRCDQTAFSLDHWRHLDPAAAAQFAAPANADEQARLQRLFITATGLGESGRLAASMTDARKRLGGTACPDGPYISATTKPRR